MELFSSHDDEALQGGTRHGTSGFMHALGQHPGIVMTAPDIGKDEQRMAMEGPVITQLVVQGAGQRDDAVAISLAVTDEELVFRAGDIVDGQCQAFAQAQAATVDELDGCAIATQADVRQQNVNLLASQDGREPIVIAGADLGEERPIRAGQQIDEEHVRRGQGLTDGFGLPMLFALHEQEVIAQLGFGDRCGIAAQLLVDEPHLAVVGVTGAIGIVAQSEQLGEAGHRLVGMGVVDGVDIFPTGGADGLEVGVVVCR